MKKRLTSEEVAEILNNTSPDKTLSKIALQSGVAASTVYNVLEAFPLWKFFGRKF